MKINLNEKTKRRTVWMTEAEMKDECLKQVFQDAKPQKDSAKYQNVIFISGHHDFFSMTEGLLLHNYGLEQTEKVQ